MDIEILFFLRNFSTLFLELVTAIIGSVYFYKYRASILKFFIIYIWIVVLIEYTGYGIRNFLGIFNNNILYNIFYGLAFPYLFSIFIKASKNKKTKKTIFIFSILYFMAFIIGAYYQDYNKEFQNMPYVLGGGLIIISIILYFIEILGTEKVLHVKKNLLFWISIGFLLFFAGSIPFTITINYYANAGGFNYLFAINYILIIILNLCFIIGFICSDKKQLY